MSPILHTQQSVKPPSGNEVGQWVRFRLGFVYVVFLAFMAMIVFRLVQLQVWPNAELSNLAQKQFEHTKKVAPPRLAIYDRNREELAVSIPAASAFARPRMIREKKKTAWWLSHILGGDLESWLGKVKSARPFVWIERQIGENQARELGKKNLQGVFLAAENKRIYPNGQLASQVVGFTDVDGNGIAGIELAMNEELLRQQTSYSLVRDGKGTPTYIDVKSMVDEEDGKLGVFLTIDRRVQYVVEEELEKAQQVTGAKALWAIVMDPNTGEIFAMSQRPTFDSNEPAASEVGAQTNRFLSHLFEPGSTLKPILAASAIEQGLMSEKTILDCANGKLKIADRTIGEAEATHKYGKIPLEKVIRVSSNIGALRVSQAMGEQKVQAALQQFGLTTKTGIKLPGEVTASKSTKPWNPVLLATAGFGQGVAMTPLQMTSAYLPFANGGKWIRPKILRRESRGEENRIERKVLSPRTVEVMRKILVSVTEDKEGTGQLARVPGMRVAGKTGTAQKYDPQLGYRAEKYLSSFIGFLPAEKPELLIAVMVDEPKGAYYGGVIAAPIFSKIASRSLHVLNRVPKTVIGEQQVGRGLVSNWTPAVENLHPTSDRWTLPDLRGVSMREALRAVGSVTPKLSFSGEGYVTEQFPPPGQEITAQSEVRLRFAMPVTD